MVLFSEAYGDHGYTLVLEADRTLLAEHSHSESVEAAIRDGLDIIPKVSVVRTYDRPHRIADTERGDQIRSEVRMLGRLIEAYRTNELRQSGNGPGLLGKTWPDQRREVEYQQAAVPGDRPCITNLDPKEPSARATLKDRRRTWRECAGTARLAHRVGR